MAVASEKLFQQWKKANSLMRVVLEKQFQGFVEIHLRAGNREAAAALEAVLDRCRAALAEEPPSPPPPMLHLNPNLFPPRRGDRAG